jgi:hypothetical protein
MCVRLLVALAFVGNVFAAGDTKLEKMSSPIPDVVSAEVRGALNPEGYSIAVGAEISANLWLCNEVETAESPSTELGVTFGTLKQGSLLGVIQLVQPWFDYKKTQIPVGTYTVRYAVMPTDGNHMGVAPYRDFLLLIAASEDKDPATALAYPELVSSSALAAGVPHPAVLALFPIWEEITEPKLVKNELDQWTLAVKLGSQVIGLVIVGHGET